MSSLRLPIFAVALAALALACSSAAPTDDEGLEGSEDAITSIHRPDADPSVLVKDPKVLTAIEERYSFASMLGARAKNAAELAAASAGYKTLADTVTADVKAVRASDRESGKGFAYLHRLFDDAWLTAPEVRFELTGILNRLDLRHKGGCGEIHFVYRLAYTTFSKPGDTSTKIDSRLPFTVNVLVPMRDDGAKCAAVARKWLALEPGHAPGALSDGPLANLPAPSRVEINYQLVRWPSTTRKDMGGHAEYQLHAFELAAGDLREVPLDDTPRTDLDAADRVALKQWIKDNVKKIDDGVAILPERFLAKTVKSVAPRASVRLGNHPYAALFSPADLADVPLADTTTVRSPGALLRKLDGTTCNGCHQSRGIAGFHLLGEERLGTARLNALAVGASPHLVAVSRWRKQFTEAVAAGRTPPRRLAPDHATGEPGAFGDHCTLGVDPGFEGWTCKSGLTCKRVDNDSIGACQPDNATPTAGDSCESSTVTQSIDPHTDTVTTKTLACAGGIHCVAAGGGFPDGVCETRCTQLGKVLADRVCSGVPFGTGPLGGFNKCLFELKRPFQECLADDVRPTLSRACDERRPCRDDYACVRVFVKPTTPDAEVAEPNPEVGACMPPYFVFQGRVDGHKLYR